MSTLAVVVGGQYGSEAKGHMTAQLVREAQHNSWDVINVRVAGPNAGHTVYDDEGNKFALRSIPVGAALSRPGEIVTCIVAAGSEVDPEVLFSELDLLESKGHRVHLVIDQNATILDEMHREQEADRDLTGKVGSTGKGIGAARADRIWRTAALVRDNPMLLKTLSLRGVAVGDTVKMLHDELGRRRVAVVIEGTQGYGLGLHTEAYPQVTSSDCRAVDFLAMAGISPWHRGIEDFRVLVTARVFPIRVAGNSGPMKGETSWGELGLAEEYTTVTQKVRRVGKWDADLIRNAVEANGGRGVTHNPFAELVPDPVAVALTMVDQVLPEIAGLTSLSDLPVALRQELDQMVEDVERDAGCKVTMVGTGPRTVIWL